MWEIISGLVSNAIILLGVQIFGVIVLGKSNNKITLTKIISFLILCILETIVYFNLSGTLKSLAMFLVYVSFYNATFNISIQKSIFLSFLCMLIFIIPEMIGIIVITEVLGFSKEFCYEVFANSLLSNTIISISAIIITFILKKVLRKIINIRIEDNIRVMIYYVLTFICISILFYKAFLNIELNINFIVSIFIILSFLAILISLIKQTLDNNKLSKEYDKLLEFMTTYENEIENQRILRHETKNEFLTIRAKICDNQENEEIVDYIDEILKDKIKVKQEEYAKFGYLPPNGIKGLCYFKIQEAEGKKIKVSLNISKRIKNSSIYKLSIKEQRDFGRILGVLLDNAIESSCDSKEKQLGIEAYMNSKGEFKMIISNTYINEVDNTKIGRERFSTKGKNRGHGLLLVKHIINEDKIFELNTRVQENIYIQTIKIKKV